MPLRLTSRRRRQAPKALLRATHLAVEKPDILKRPRATHLAVEKPQRAALSPCTPMAVEPLRVGTSQLVRSITKKFSFPPGLARTMQWILGDIASTPL